VRITPDIVFDQMVAAVSQRRCSSRSREIAPSGHCMLSGERWSVV
jgi:hypothetical protein